MVVRRDASAMLWDVARRVGASIVVIGLVATLTFALVVAAPGDAATLLAGDDGDADTQARAAAAFGIDRPVWRQYATWVGHIALFDLGFSSSFRAPVGEVIAGRLPATLALMLPALVISSLAAAALGLASGARSRWSGTATLVIGAGVAAVPVYAIAQGLVLVFSLKLGWLPVQGLGSPRGTASGFAALLDILRHLALPTIALTLQQLLMGWLFVRARVREELRLDYVRTARSKGLDQRDILVRHVWPNIRLGFVHYVAARFAGLLAGAVLVETMFGIPGMGRLMVAAALARDLPLVAGIFLFAAALVVTVNAIADVLGGFLDPRVASEPPPQ